MEKVRLYKYCFTYFIGYVVFAMGLTQYVPYLSSIGYTASQRGFMISMYAITTIAFQLLLGYVSDKLQKTKLIFMLAMMGFAISTSALYAVEKQIFILHLILVAISGGLVNADFGVFDSWLFSNGKEEVESFSFIRAFGSAGWALSCVLISPIISVLGYRQFGMVSLLLSMLVCFCVQMSSVKKSASKNKNKRIRIQDVKKIVANKKYVILTITLFFIFCTTTTSASVIIDKMLYLGANSQEIGLRWAICGGVEIPIYFIGARILRRLGSYKLLVISAILVTIQYFLYMITSSIVGILIVSGMQMFTGPLVMLASRKLYYDFAPEELRSTSLLVAISVYQGISMLIMPIVCGIVTQHIGVNISLLIATCSGTIGTLCAMYLYTIQKKEVSYI